MKVINIKVINKWKKKKLPRLKKREQQKLKNKTKEEQIGVKLT